MIFCLGVFIVLLSMGVGAFFGWYWTQEYWFKELRASDKKLQEDMKKFFDDLDYHISLCHKDDKDK